MESEYPNAIKKETELDEDKQRKLAALVVKHGENWKSITTQMGFKSKREAIIEFLRLPLTSEDYLAERCLRKEAKEYDMTEIEPYNQMDQIKFQCKLLEDFAHAPLSELERAEREQQKESEEQTDEYKKKKRVEKEKRKLCNLILMKELKELEKELEEYKETDKCLAKASNEIKSIQTQMFAERVSLSISSRHMQASQKQQVMTS